MFLKFKKDEVGTPSTIVIQEKLVAQNKTSLLQQELSTKHTGKNFKIYLKVQA
jgi:hypothetical protein